MFMTNICFNLKVCSLVTAFWFTIACCCYIGLQIIYTLDEVSFIQNLVFYIQSAYRTPVSFVWCHNRSWKLSLLLRLQILCVVFAHKSTIIYEFLLTVYAVYLLDDEFHILLYFAISFMNCVHTGFWNMGKRR